MSNPYGADVTGAIYDGPTACAVKFAPINHTAAFNTTIVPAVSGKKIRVLSYVVVVSGATTIYFANQIGGGLSGQLVFDGSGKGVSASYSPIGHFETPVGEYLQIVSTASLPVGGHLTYIEVSA
jgi:hypothetical protein